MQIKKYEAMDMQEALRRVKDDLGSEAVILSSRKVKRGTGTFGMLGRPMVEVTAAIDYPEERSNQVVSAYAGKGPGPGSDMMRTGSGAVPLEVFVREDIQQMKEEIQTLLRQAALSTPSALKEIRTELAGLRNTLQGIPVTVGLGSVTSGPVTPEAGVLHECLAVGIEEDLARRLVRLLERQEAEASTETSGSQGTSNIPGTKQKVYELIRQQTRVTGPVYQDGQGRKSVLFVGPTGAGKTTTLAKVAARYALGKKKKVVLISLDTYRIAAVEQLKIYGKIIGIPVEVALTPGDLQKVYRRYPEIDLFLVDTAGRNQKDPAVISDLQEYVMAEAASHAPRALSLECHLVVPATMRSDVMRDVIRRFSEVPCHGIIFSKLDEVTAYGQIFNAMIRAQKPLSYFTTGQRVPEDIEDATPERLAALVIGTAA